MLQGGRVEVAGQGETAGAVELQIVGAHPCPPPRLVPVAVARICLGQAGVDVVTDGAAGTPTYNEGVAIIPLTNLGLMAEFSAAGTKYNYKPYKK